nr:acetyl-CoA-benzylalcohol acetyltransferase-like [Ipomoea batatas]
MEDSSIGNGAARIDTDEYMTMNCLFKRIAVRGVRVRNPELSAAAMVMVTGVLCCDGDGDATGNTATRSTLLRQQVLSAAGQEAMVRKKGENQYSKDEDDRFASNLQITGDDKVQLQRLSFNGGSFFPVKNFPVEMPPLGHDMEVVTRRFVLNARNVSSLRTEFKEYFSKVNGGGGASVRTPSRVTLVTAVFWKALIGVSAASRHTLLRPSILSPAINLRGRTSFPAISNDSSGNFWTPFVAHFKPAANNEGTLTWQDLVGPITDAMQTMFNLVQHGSGDEISRAAIKAFKEVHETMAAGGHGEVDAFICSSWCRFGLYEADFGWGKPACVSANSRSEMFLLMDSSGGDEGIDVWVSMDEPKMQLLQQDPHIIALTST